MFPIIIIFLLALVTITAFIATRPDEFLIERSLVINSSSERIYSNIEKLATWEKWSPWAKLDPNVVSKYSGPTNGKGAIYVWAGNDKVGQGRMEILSVKQNKEIQIDLQFNKPIKADNVTVFNFHPEDAGTTVIWSMTGRRNFTGKMFNIVLNLDKMIGKDFEKGLASLKSLSENPAS